MIYLANGAVGKCHTVPLLIPRLVLWPVTQCGRPTASSCRLPTLFHQTEGHAREDEEDGERKVRKGRRKEREEEEEKDSKKVRMKEPWQMI